MDKFIKKTAVLLLVISFLVTSVFPVSTFARNIGNEKPGVVVENDSAREQEEKSNQTVSPAVIKIENPLLIVETYPKYNAAEIPIDVSISITFNKSITAIVSNNSRGRDRNDIILKDVYGKSISNKFTIEENKLIIKPINKLETNTKYELIINKNIICGVDDTRLKEDFTLLFTTVENDEQEDPKIVSISDIAHTVYQGADYRLPKNLAAVMSDGSSREVPVKWKVGVVNTSIIGTYTFEGSVEGYNRKVFLTLIVKAGALTIDDIAQTIYKGDSYVLPRAVSVTMSDGIRKEMPVIWSPYVVDTSREGIYTFEGTVEGYDKKVILTLTILEKTITIDDINRTIGVNNTYTLPKTVTAAMSDGTTKQLEVVWNVDTSKAITYTFEGMVAGLNEKVTLNLVVQAQIDSIGDLNQTIYQGDSFILPGTVAANMNDGTVKDVPVAWNPSSVDTNILGTYIYEGTVQGYGSKVKQTLNIVPKAFQVESVTTMGLNGVKVVFSKEVDKDSAVRLSNYMIDGISLQDGMDTAFLASDNKTLHIINGTPFTQYKKILLTIKDKVVLSKDTLTTIPKSEAVLTFSDTAVPVVENVSVTGNKKLTVQFNEPVNLGTLANYGSYFKIDGQYLSSYGFTSAVPSIATTVNGYGMKVDLNFDVAIPAGVHTLKTLKGSPASQYLVDAAGFAVPETDKSVTVEAVTSAPQIVGITAGTNGTVYVTFDRQMSYSARMAANYSVNSNIGGVMPVSVAFKPNTDNKVVKVTFPTANISAGANIITIDNEVKDVWGNKLHADTDQRFSFIAVADTVKPAVISVMLVDNQNIRVKFSEDVDSAYARTISNYTLKNSSGVTKAIASITVTSDDDTYTLTAVDKLTESNYSLTIKNIIDKAYPGNTMDEYTATFNGLDDVAPVVTQVVKVAGSSSKVSVYFSEAMDAATITDLANYAYLNNKAVSPDIKALPAECIITTGEGNRSATIEFPLGYSITTVTVADYQGSNYMVNQIRVSNVKDTAGNILKNISTIVPIIVAEVAADGRPKYVENTFKLYADTSKAWAEFELNQTLTNLVKDDFYLSTAVGGVQIKANSATVSGRKVILNFVDEAGDSRRASVMALGKDAKLYTVAIPASANISGIPIASMATDVDAKRVWDDQIAPELIKNGAGRYVEVVAPGDVGVPAFIATTAVVLTFSEAIDESISGLYRDDFTFTTAYGVLLSVSRVTVSGAKLYYEFTAPITLYDDITVKAQPGKIDIRDLKDAGALDYNLYIPNIIPEAGKPTVTSVELVDNMHIRVKFSEEVDPAFATNIFNYVLKDSSGVTKAINSISVTVADNTFTLETADKLTGTAYTLQIKNIVDKDIPGNTMDEHIATFNGIDDVSPSVVQVVKVAGSSNKVAVYFSEAMDAADITSKANYAYLDNRNTTQTYGLPSSCIITAGENNRYVTIEFPTGYSVTTQTLADAEGSVNMVRGIRVSNVKGMDGNVLKDIAQVGYVILAFDAAAVKPRYVYNTFKLYADSSKAWAEFEFDQTLTSLNIKDFYISGTSGAPVLTPDSGFVLGRKIVLNFYNIDKKAIVMALGPNANLFTQSTLSANSSGIQIAPINGVRVYDDKIAPVLIRNNGMSYIKVVEPGAGMPIATKAVMLTFSENIDDTISGLYKDDFIFTSGYGALLTVTRVIVQGQNIYFEVDPATPINPFDYIAFRAQIGKIDIRDLKDAGAQDYNLYAPVTVPETEKPKVTSVSLVDSTHIQVKFSEEVDTAYATNIFNYELKDSSGAVKAINSIAVTVADNAFTLETADKLTGTMYALKIKNIIDKDIPGNTMDEYVATFNGIDDVSPSVVQVVKVAGSSNKVAVYFSEAMDAATITNVANYGYIDNRTTTQTYGLPSSCIVTAGENNRYVTIEFPAGYSVTTQTVADAEGSVNMVRGIKVSNVKDAVGNILKDSTQTGYVILDTNDNAAIQVESVSAMGLNGVKVVFSKEVDRESAIKASNYQFNGVSLVDWTDMAILAPDYRTLYIMLSTKFNQDARALFIVKDNVVLSKNTVMSVPKYEKELVFSDVKDPGIDWVSVTGNNKLTLQFTEPVKMGELYNAANKFMIDGQYLSCFGFIEAIPVPYMAPSPGENSSYGLKLDLRFDAAIPAGVHSLKILRGTDTAFSDAAGHMTPETDINFMIESVAGAPQVVKVEGYSNGVVYVTYDRPMSDNARITANYAINGDIGMSMPQWADFKADTNRKVAKVVFPTFINPGPNILTIENNVKDAWGNKLHDDTDQRYVFNVGIDTIKPMVESVSLVNNANIRIRFNEDVDPAYAMQISNYELKDSSGVSIPISNIFVNSADEIYTIIPVNKLTGLNYTLKVKNIIDKANPANTMDEYTATFNGIDDVAPIVTQAVKEPFFSNKVTVYFSEAMDAASIIDPANYAYLNDKPTNPDTRPLPPGCRITAGQGNKSAAIEFPTGYSIVLVSASSDAIGSDYNIRMIRVSNVKDAVGNMLNNISTVVSIIDAASAVNGKPKYVQNTFKLFADANRAWAEFEFDQTLAPFIMNDFYIEAFSSGGIQTITPDSGYTMGKKVILNFNKGSGKRALVMAIGKDARLSTIASPTSTNSSAITIAVLNGVQVYDEKIAPEWDGVVTVTDTVGVFGTVDGTKSVKLHFSENIDDTISGLYKDDFKFITNYGTLLDVANTVVYGQDIYYSFAQLVTTETVVTVKPQAGKIDIRDLKDAGAKDQNLYAPVIVPETGKPTVTSVTLLDNAHIKVKFSEDVSPVFARNISNYELKDSSGVTKIITSIAIETADNEYILGTLDKLTGPNYTLKIMNIIDKNSPANTMDDYTAAFSGIDNVVPAVTQAVRVTGSSKKVAVYFSEAMDAATITNPANYAYLNNRPVNTDTLALPAMCTITAGEDNKYAIIEFPTGYSIALYSAASDSEGSNYAVRHIRVSNVKDAAGNMLNYISAVVPIIEALNAVAGKPKYVENTFKLYADSSKAWAEFELDQTLALLNIFDFYISTSVTGAFITPSSGYTSGKKVVLNFNDYKRDAIMALGKDARLFTVTTATVASASISGIPMSAMSEDVSSKQVWDDRIAPELVRNGVGKYVEILPPGSGLPNVTNAVALTFSENIDPSITGLYKDDFTFTTTNGVMLTVSRVFVIGSRVYYEFDAATPMNMYDIVTVKAQPAKIDIKDIKDAGAKDQNLYVPKSYDVTGRTN